MPSFKNQHYVPKFYLRNFSADGSSVSLFNLSSERTIHGASIKHQCSSDHFYGKDGKTEAHLREIEGLAARLIGEVISSEHAPDLDTFEPLLLFTLIQNGRTLYHSEAMNEMVEKFTTHALKKSEKFTAEEISIGKIKMRNASVFGIASAAQSLALCMDLQCKLVVVTSGGQLITSDNPVAMYNQFMESPSKISNTGLPSRGLQIFFPISPSHMLVFFDRDVYDVGNRKSQVIRIKSQADVDQLNILQFISSGYNVYGLQNFDFPESWKRAKGFRRAEKSSFQIIPASSHLNEQAEYIISSKVDIKTDLNLSFMQVRKEAKEWREKFRNLKLKPPIVPRNEAVFLAHQEYSELFRKKETSLDFAAWLREKWRPS